MLYFRDGNGNCLRIMSLYTFDVMSNLNVAILRDCEDGKYLVVYDLEFTGVDTNIGWKFLEILTEDLDEATDLFLNKINRDRDKILS